MTTTDVLNRTPEVNRNVHVGERSADVCQVRCVFTASALHQAERGRLLVPPPPHPLTMASTSPAISASWTRWATAFRAARA